MVQPDWPLTIILYVKMLLIIFNELQRECSELTRSRKNNNCIRKLNMENINEKESEGRQKVPRTEPLVKTSKIMAKDAKGLFGSEHGISNDLCDDGDSGNGKRSYLRSGQFQDTREKLMLHIGSLRLRLNPAATNAKI